MKYLYISIIAYFLLIQGCKGQTTISQRSIYNKEFKWLIAVPENFENVSPEQSDKLQNKGTAAIEKTYDAKIENRTKTIFLFKSDKLNYFESNYQPFDTVVDGSYSESCKNVNEVLYQTFKTQVPAAKIDTITSKETIDNLEFRTFSVEITYPNQMIMHILMYSRLFGKKEFAVNMMYVDKMKGEAMLNAWRNSKFSK